MTIHPYQVLSAIAACLATLILAVASGGPTVSLAALAGGAFA